MRMKLTLALAALVAALGGALALGAPAYAAPLGTAALAAVEKAEAGNSAVEQVHRRRHWGHHRHHAYRHHYRPYRYYRPYPYYYSYPSYGYYGNYGYYRPYSYGYGYYRRPRIGVYLNF